MLDKSGAKSNSGNSDTKAKSIKEINNFFEEHGAKRQKFYADNQALIKEYIQAFEAAVKNGAYQTDTARFESIKNFIQRFKDWKTSL
jgi:hypothetical protein